MQLVDVNLVMTCLIVLEQLLSACADTKELMTTVVLEMYLVYALTWSVGAVLELEDRVKFDRNLRNLANTSGPEQVADTIFEYYVDEPSHQWAHWRGRIPRWEYPEKDPVEFASLIVPTLDSIRYESVMHIFRMREKPVLMMGLQGVTKTTTVNQYLSTQKSDEFGVKNVTFSCATSPEVLVALLCSPPARNVQRSHTSFSRQRRAYELVLARSPCCTTAVQLDTFM
jgi:dynein heavy chain